MKIKLVSNSETQTRNIAKKIAHVLQPGTIIGLQGELGAGKTCFIKALGKALGIKEDITSPSFTILNVYEAKNSKFYHFDLYRIKSYNEIFDIGYKEFVYGNGISAIEWIDKLPELKKDLDLEIELDIEGDLKRKIIFQCKNKFLKDKIKKVLKNEE